MDIGRPARRLFVRSRPTATGEARAQRDRRRDARALRLRLFSTGLDIRQGCASLSPPPLPQPTRGRDERRRSSLRRRRGPCRPASRTTPPRLRPRVARLRDDGRSRADRRAGRPGARRRGGRLGTKIDKKGFNLFVIGPDGARHAGRGEGVAGRGRARPAEPLDWVYVNNFSKPDRPIAIELPPGRAPSSSEAMHELIEDLKIAAAGRLPERGLSDAARRDRRGVPEEAVRGLFRRCATRRAKRHLHPAHAGRVCAGAARRTARSCRPTNSTPGRKPSASRSQADIEALEKELEHIVRQSRNGRRNGATTCARSIAKPPKFAVDHLIEEVKAAFTDIAARRSNTSIWCARDLIENIAAVRRQAQRRRGEERADRAGRPFDRYEVNVLVDPGRRATGAPIVEELHPTLGNLIGRIEYSRAGRARHQFPADQGRRAASRQRRLSPARCAQPADRAVQLDRAQARAAPRRDHDRGRRPLPRPDQHRLARARSDSARRQGRPVRRSPALFSARRVRSGLGEHFKVLADFEDDFDRTPENEATLRPPGRARSRERDGLQAARSRRRSRASIEHAARLADHAGKLSLVVDDLRDVLIEADFWARRGGTRASSRAPTSSARSTARDPPRRRGCATARRRRSSSISR